MFSKVGLGSAGGTTPGPPVAPKVEYEVPGRASMLGRGGAGVWESRLEVGCAALAVSLGALLLVLEWDGFRSSAPGEPSSVCWIEGLRFSGEKLWVGVELKRPRKEVFRASSPDVGSGDS